MYFTLKYIYIYIYMYIYLHMYVEVSLVLYVSYGFLHMTLCMSLLIKELQEALQFLIGSHAFLGIVMESMN